MQDVPLSGCPTKTLYACLISETWNVPHLSHTHGFNISAGSTNLTIHNSHTAFVRPSLETKQKHWEFDVLILMIMASIFFVYVRRSILVGQLLYFRASRSFHLQGRRVNRAGRYRYRKDVASEPMEEWRVSDPIFAFLLSPSPYSYTVQMKIEGSPETTVHC